MNKSPACLISSKIPVPPLIEREHFLKLGLSFVYRQSPHLSPLFRIYHKSLTKGRANRLSINYHLLCVKYCVCVRKQREKEAMQKFCRIFFSVIIFFLNFMVVYFNLLKWMFPSFRFFSIKLKD